MKETDIISINDLKLIRKLEKLGIIDVEDVIRKTSLEEEVMTKEGVQYLGIRDLLLFELNEELPISEELVSYLNNAIYKRFKSDIKTATIEHSCVENTFQYLNFPKIDYVLYRFGFNLNEVELLDEKLIAYLNDGQRFNLNKMFEDINKDRKHWIKDRKEYAFYNKIKLILEINSKLLEEKEAKKVLVKE